MSENWIKTLSVNQIPDDEAVDFDVGNNKKIAIFNVNNNFFATDNLCTHEDASLCDGYIDGDDDDEYGPPRESAVMIASNKISEQIH